MGKGTGCLRRLEILLPDSLSASAYFSSSLATFLRRLEEVNRRVEGTRKTVAETKTRVGAMRWTTAAASHLNAQQS